MEDRAKFKVRFTETERELTLDEVQLIASFDSWNDFGYKIRCKCKLFNPYTEKEVSFESFIGFLPPLKGKDSNLYKDYSNYFSAHGTSLADMIGYIEHLESNDSIGEFRFFTMLPSMGAYRDAVHQLGPELLADVLEVINDLVYYKDKKANWFTDAINSEAFSLGFMRNSEPFFAYSNADSVLGGVEEEVFDGISQKLTLKYNLEGFKNEHEIKLNYDQSGYIPKRINILIGKNGLGKSQALKSFCRAALRYQDNSISLSDDTFGDRPMINRLLAIATPGETQNTFPAERRKTQKLYYRRLSLTRNTRSIATKSISELLVQLARNDETIGERSRWSLFFDSVQNVMRTETIFVQLKDETSVPLKTIFYGGGEQEYLIRWSKVDPNIDPKIKYSNKLHSMSSGQLTFFKFALLCCLYIENGSFVLLDEPETHMHPNMISDFVEMLDYMLEVTGSQALIATHSAYFVREVPQEQVHVFKKEANNVCISNPRLTTFGAPVDSISRFVFDDDAESKLAEKLYLRIKRQNTTFEDIVNTLGDEISVAAMMKLRQKMEEA